MSDRIVVDAKNTYCPGPLMELIAGMKQAAVGDELEVLATDKVSANDIPEWIKKVGHQVLDSFDENGVWHVIVRKEK